MLRSGSAARQTEFPAKEERWAKIAERVQGKSTAECLERYTAIAKVRRGVCCAGGAGVCVGFYRSRPPAAPPQHTTHNPGKRLIENSQRRFSSDMSLLIETYVNLCLILF